MRHLLVTLTVLLAAPAVVQGHAAPQSEEQRISAILQSTLVAHGEEVHRCFEKALADTLDVAGKLELQVDVGADGRVTKATPAMDEVKSPVLLACLQATAQTWTLAGIDPGSTVIVPLSFQGQATQFSVRVADAPNHGPLAGGAGKGNRKGPAPGGAPFSVKLLVDEATMRAQQASMSLLTVSPANRIAMHKHPGAEILYVLKGRARILGPQGTAPEKLDEGTAIFIPASMPHVIENMGRQASAVLLQIFAPLGPERVYRDPKDATGRAAFEVIRDLSKAIAPPGAHFTVASQDKVVALPAAKKSRVRLLLETTTGSQAASLSILEADAGAEVARHSHPGSAELLYVVTGAGEVTIGSESVRFGPEQALHIPQNQPHAAKFTEKTVAIQVFAPAGPEQQFKKPPAPAKGK